MRATDLLGATFPREPTGDAEFDALTGGGLARPSTSLAWGKGGSGKSRALMRWASALGPSLMLTLEMGAELAAMQAKSAGADTDRIFMCERESGWQRAAKTMRAKSILVDSLAYLQRPADALRELHDWAQEHRGIVLVICHSNGRGGAYGGRRWEHWPDYNLRFAPKGKDSVRVTIPKSRFCQRGSCVLSLV